MLEPPAENCSGLVVSYCLGLSAVSSQNSVVLTQGLCAVHVVFFSSCCWSWRSSPGCEGVSLVLESLSGCNLCWGFLWNQLSFIWQRQELLIYIWGKIWIALTTHTILATSVHPISHFGLGKRGIRFPGINRICIEQVDSDKRD